MALSAKTLKVLKDAGLEPVDVALFSDEDLLGLPGVGPAALADIRATYPAPGAAEMADASEIVAVVEPVESLATAARKVLGGVAVEPAPSASAPATAEPPGCTCVQPFRVTRTRQRAGRIERYCDVCGAVMGASPERGLG